MADAVESAGEALLQVDHDVHEAMRGHHKRKPVKLLGLLSDIGDQPQLRLLCGSVMVLGLVRRDPRMLAAGVRMLVSHEVATAAKSAVKDRVHRRRPRSADGKDEEQVREGGKPDKEESSFPSGHSAGSLAVASAYSAVFPEYKTPALLGAAAVALAQIPRCAHYPTDVAAGLAIGGLSDKIVGVAIKAVRVATSRILRL